MKISAILDRAADVIENSGWVQGAMHRDGKFCMIGAVQQVAFIAPQWRVELQMIPQSYVSIEDLLANPCAVVAFEKVWVSDTCSDNDRHRTLEFLTKWLMDNETLPTFDSATYDPYMNRHVIPGWNDAEGRTQEEVVKVLRRAAQDAAFHE